MREFATPSTYRLPPVGNLTDDVVANATDHPSAVVCSVRRDGAWRDVTAVEFLAQVSGVAKGLLASGVGAGDRVLLLSRTRYEWTVLDYAIWFAGAVSVPAYESATVDQLSWLLGDSGATVALVETPEHRERVEKAWTSAAGADAAPGQVWGLDEGAVHRLTERGMTVTDSELEARRTTARPTTLATIVYTSGTTGRPKGCMLTHGSFMTELTVAVEALDGVFDEGSSTLLFLPLAHVLARVVQVGAVRTRTRLGHVAGIAHLVRDLEEFRPTFVLAVPRVFERLFTTSSQQAAADGRGAVFDRAAETAIAWSRASDTRRPGPLLRARHRLFDRLVYARLRATLGDRCRWAVSGGAPLGERLGHFYRGIGLSVLEGYGLTETTASATLNLPDAFKVGTVGRPLGGTTVRVADDGELEVRGGQLFAGYWRDEEATAAVLRDGWLRTGDLGEIDDEGFVRVTGRKQELLVTLGGKNVAPTLLEDELRAHPLVSQCMVVGDGRPFIAAIVTLDREALSTWARTHGTSDDPRRAAADPLVRAEIQAGVDRANTAVSQAEAIRRFTVLAEDWTEEGGQLTPSLKLRRTVVAAQVRAEVEALYAP